MHRTADCSRAACDAAGDANANGYHSQLPALAASAPEVTEDAMEQVPSGVASQHLRCSRL